MRVVVPAETRPGERRVAAVPATVPGYVGAGLEVVVQSGAGVPAGHADEEYVAQGASIADQVYPGADVVLRVRPPSPQEAARIPEGGILLCMLQPGQELELVRTLAERKVAAFSLDLLPRISRAQSMDALSSQATVSGYRAALLAAERLPRFFPLLMTAAGTVPPARVLVIGAGVAGLQAIATCRRLGAVVEAYDVRAAAKEEVVSVGAQFVELPLETQEAEGGYAREQSEDYLRRQQELLAEHVASSDVVITTAAIPGRTAPRIVTREMVEGMRPGSVIVDLAAETGGNCELSVSGEDVVHQGVVVHGARDVPSQMPGPASQLYARNLADLLKLLVKEGRYEPDFDDEVVAGTCVTRDGEVVNARARELLEAGGR